MAFFKPIIDLVLYGNFWIALCALCMYWQTQLLLGHQLEWDALAGFSLFGTLFLYAVHRIVGISNLKEFFEVDRYHVIAYFRNHIRLYALIGLLGSLYYFFQLRLSTQLVLFLPSLLSLGYVIPFIGNQRKRLRDMDFVKIYLVAIVWAWITVVLPLIEQSIPFQPALVLMVLERALFIFAITLPFDIRDLEVDAFGKVKTIPAVLGEKRSRRLAQFSLLICVALAVLQFSMGHYPLKAMLGMGLAYALTAWLIQLSNSQRHDYFYSGLMDGSMIFQFLLVYLSLQL
ncbi:MAG: UbiA family prenyltransferase [Bacteroidota bacterium]